MNMNIFERALRARLRFDTPAGQVTTEHLWELPLTRGDKLSLDNVAKTVNSQLKSITEESFVSTVENTAVSELQLKMEIVKYVIASKIAAEASVTKAAETRARKQMLLAALGKKQQDELSGMTSAELEAEIAKL
jgi:hypothetical protein